MSNVRITGEERNELTGLMGEKAFFDAAHRIAPEHMADWCMIAIDVEHFKLFNDWYGREKGDLLLAEIGIVLEKERKETGGIAGYLGQDDFCIFMPYEKNRIDRLYQKIHDLIVEASTLVGFLPAFGISLVEPDVPMMALYDRAALAASHVKGNFHTRIRLYRHSMNERTAEEYQILSDFQSGLANKELFFYLQPQCRISTGQIVGAEALVRWKTGDGRIILPGSFLPVLEKYGFIVDMDQYIWEEVCIWLRNWIDRGNTPLPISVNVSRIDIFTFNVPAFFEELVQKYDLPKKVLKIEITESTYAENITLVEKTVKRLREMGFTVLMDDFGSGYSSLNMLRSLNVDILKLDGQFLQLDGSDTRKGMHILESIVNMTKNMALPIIVEGVENEEQAHFLGNLGCRYAQGFQFYRPMKVDEFEKLILDGKNVDTSGFSFKANQEFHIREFLDESIYSDTMLNNILGATVFYSRNGDQVDIIRFNEQFYEMVGVPDFEERMTDIQRFFPPEDRKLFLDLLDQAEKDQLNGSSGMLRVYRVDEVPGNFFVTFYYLEESANGKVYYGALQDITEMTKLQNQMKLLSEYSTDSIVFMSRHDGVWNFQIPVHGTSQAMGLSAEEFQKELNDGSFYQRIDEKARLHLWKITMDSEEYGKSFSIPFEMVNTRGEHIELYMKTDYVHDAYSDVEYILMFRLREDTFS